MIDYLPRPIFIIGYMHSGTSLLQDIVSRSRDVYSSNGETKFFEHIELIRHRFPNISDEKTLEKYIQFLIGLITEGYKLKEDYRKSVHLDAKLEEFRVLYIPELKQKAGQNPDYSAIFSLVFSYLSQFFQKPRWLEKTPTHIFHIEKIIQSHPDALFLLIVRDPRDVIASKKTRTENVWRNDKFSSGRKKYKRYEKAFDALWDTLSWKAAIQAGESGKRKFSDQILVLTYENLVKDPQDEVARICGFLSIPVEPEMLRIETHNSADKTNSFSRENGGIFNTSIGRWKRVLSKEEVHICQQFSRHELKELGYEIEIIPLKNRAKALFLYWRSMAEFFVRLFHRWQLGGVSYFLLVIKSYIRRLSALLRIQR